MSNKTPKKQSIDICYKNLSNKTYIEKYGPPKLRVDPDLEITFDNMGEFLLKHGYDVKPAKYGENEFWVTGHGIRGSYQFDAIFETHDYPQAVFDNAEAYNKQSQTPFQFAFPIRAKDLFRKLKMLASPAAYEISSRFYYLDNNPFAC